MNKIPTAFLRDLANPSRVTALWHPDALWVRDGLGTPTVKRDGMNVFVGVRGGTPLVFKKRRNPTREEKAAGAEPGYVMCEAANPADTHLWAAFSATDFSGWPDGEWPCEALGPKIQGGVESPMPCLYPFSWKPELLPDCERTLEGFRTFLADRNIEGIVWHEVVGDPAGRLVKLKARDLGLPWPRRG